MCGGFRQLCRDENGAKKAPCGMVRKERMLVLGFSSGVHAGKEFLVVFCAENNVFNSAPPILLFLIAAKAKL